VSVIEGGGGNFLIVGCGAVGGVVAGHLIDQGANVTVTTTNDAVAKVVAEKGLAVQTPERSFRVATPLPSAPDAQDRFRYILLATQASRAEEAARVALPALADNGFMVVLQNGLCEERVAKIIGEDRVVGAVVGWGATRSDEGVFTKLGPGGFTVGTLKGGDPGDSLSDLTERLSSVGRVKTTANLRGARWSKLAVNCAVSGLGTVLGDRMGILLRHRFCRRLALEVMTETVTVALAEGVRLEPIAGTVDPTWVALTEGERRAPVHPRLIAKHMLLVAIGTKFRKMRSSMLRAIESGRSPGVDLLNGEVVTRGRLHGIPTPYNAAIQRMVEAQSRGDMPHGLASLKAIRTDTAHAARL
jgi:2-dehydropantoate 2-reductase